MSSFAKKSRKARQMRDVCILVIANYYMQKAIKEYGEQVESGADRMYLEAAKRVKRVVCNFKLSYLKRAEAHINKVMAKLRGENINAPYLPVILLMIWYLYDDKTVHLGCKNLLSDLLGDMSKGFEERGQEYKKMRRKTDDMAELIIEEIVKEVGCLEQKRDKVA